MNLSMNGNAAYRGDRGTVIVAYTTPPHSTEVTYLQMFISTTESLVRKEKKGHPQKRCERQDEWRKASGIAYKFIINPRN